MGLEFDELKAFHAQLEKMRDEELAVFNERAVKRLAAKLLELVVPLTPVNDRTYGDVKGKERVVKQGGTLRRGWTAQTHAEAESGNGAPDASQIIAYIHGMQVSKDGGLYSIEIVNPVEYAAYVENGHRQTPGRYVPAIGKQLVVSFVEGQHFLEKSTQQLENAAPSILQEELESFLKGAFDG